MIKFDCNSDSLGISNAATPQPLDMEIDTNNQEVLLINTRNFPCVEDCNSQGGGKPRDFLEILKQNDDLRSSGVPKFRVVQLEVLKHSAGQNHNDWISLANLIQANYHTCRGFVVVNGTDNMVSTSTALSFMLENLGKPVVFTGSRIPPERLYTDLWRNLIVALLFANCSQLNEVCILFDEQLFRANRSIKVSRSTLTPFDSPHFPPLASMHGAIHLHKPFLRLHPRGQFRVMDKMQSVVLTLKLGPSLRQEVLQKAVELTKARAVVIIAYGDGNGPSRDGYMSNIVKKSVERGILVVVCTQNLYGSVNLGAYEVGEELLKAGAVSAHDMTIEATIMKLKYLLGVGLSTNDVKKFFSNVNLRGELTLQKQNL
ncbi:cytoplasmic l-asparaginase i-like protein [Trypanosoma theileri]|uniref:asparaginase n=1 Tax=Trypanosoma theileri TaxID=67003 RepID=A0A1X0P1U7_9TRYP|nr:cytoplasmic l-asparaginase i-like protein [Trypanosoma theileri]ORC90380.1 cytoplasmic l-asparaginase i-like protein [Trypanosoma theileri]